MLRTDFSNQPYIAEILKAPLSAAEKAPAIIQKLVHGRSSTEKPVAGKWADTETVTESDGAEILLYHGFVASTFAYHRTNRSVAYDGGRMVPIPRTATIRRQEQYLYDVLLVRRNEHIVIAVPFHGLATRVFLDIDKALAGTGTEYEKLNITNMVIRLGSGGRLPVKGKKNDGEAEIVVTRCHLAYSDPSERRRDLEQVRLTGYNLGASNIYSDLVTPVLSSKRPGLIVIPILLGFALVRGGVRKSSATTDRHGNFKVTVGPGLRQVTRLFQLLDEIQRLQNVVSTTPNVPILQSAVIETAE